MISLNNIFNKGIIPVVLAGFLLVFPYKIQWIIILVLGLNFFYNFHEVKKVIEAKTLFIFSIPFLVFALGLLHFNYNDLRFVQRVLPFLLYPIFLMPYFKCNIIKERSKITFYYYLSYIISGVFFIIIAYYNFLFNKKEWWGAFYDSETLRNSIRYISFIKLDPIYVSFYFCIAVVFSFNLYLKKRNYIFLVTTILFIIFILLLSNKMAILSLFVVSLLFLLKFFKFKKVLYSAVLIIAFLLILINNNRFKEVMMVETYSGQSKTDNSTSIRFNLFKSSISLLPDNWLYGMGFSSVKKNVSEVFINKYNGDKEYNTHNQYICVWLATGLFGLILFVYYLWYIFRIALFTNDQVFLSVLIIITMNLFTENMLERQFGVLLISYLITFLGYINMKNINE